MDTDPTLVSDLNALLEPITAGEPDDSPLRWTSKSVSKLTAELQALGHAVGRRRLFSYIAMNWRGKPLVSLATVVNLIGATTTRSGLRVRSEIDTRSYPQWVKVIDEQMQRINLSRHAFHGDWNYTIEPISVS